MKLSQEDAALAIKLGFTVPTWKLISEYQKTGCRPDQVTATREGLNNLLPFAVNGVVLFLAIVISAAIWIWALVILIKYGATMPTWSLILSIIFMFVVPIPIITIILVYVTRGQKKNSP